MDIEFIEEEHRDSIFQIMELCGIDMAEAYQLYTNNGNNVENAVQAKFNPIPNANDFSEPFQTSSPKMTRNEEKFPNVNHEDDYEDYKDFMHIGKRNFGQRYPVRREQSLISNMWNKFVKPAESSYKKKLEDYIGRRTDLKLHVGTLSESLESISKSKFPLLVHTSDFNPQHRESVSRVYNDQTLIKVFNEQFENYGFDPREYKIEDFMQEFINPINDANAIVVFRVSIVEQVKLVAKIHLGGMSEQEVKKKVKQVKSNCINLEMEEEHLVRRFEEELKGNFDYRKPISLSEQKKIKEDREIRRKQEEEFFASMQPQPSQTHPQADQVHQPKFQAPAAQKDNREEILKKRASLRSRLKDYSGHSGTVAIKLRLPSGDSTKVEVSGSEQTQYLFDFIESREADMGFENELERKFDIIEPYEKINLSERKDEAIGKVFEGEQMLQLIVTERTD